MTDLNKYLDAKTQLAFWKKKEHELRLELLNDLFPNASNGTFTEHVEGYEVKGTFGLNYSIIKDEFDILKDVMTDDERSCITLKPTLSVAKYKLLEDHERAILDECVSVKPSLPSVKILEV